MFLVMQSLLNIHLLVREDDWQVDFKSAVSASLQWQMLASDDVRIPIMSAAVDPRHNQLKILSAGALQRVHNWLSELPDQLQNGP